MEQDWKELPGWINENEGDALFKYASMIPGAGCIVEIGSWMGKSTIALALGLKENPRRGDNLVYAIDPHQDTEAHRLYYNGNTMKEFNRNINRFGVYDLVQAFQATSEEVADGWEAKIDLLFVDGDHQYAAVKKDLQLWLPHLNQGGIVMCHDYDGGTPGVVQAVQEMVPLGAFNYLPREGSLFIGRKI